MSTESDSMIGRRVEVLLQREPRTWQTGRLLSLDHEGECQVEDDDGVIHHCWPALDVTPLPSCPVGYDGRHWRPQPCERGPGHDRGHCDRYGRTW